MCSTTYSAHAAAQSCSARRVALSCSRLPPPAGDGALFHNAIFNSLSFVLLEGHDFEIENIKKVILRLMCNNVTERLSWQSAVSKPQGGKFDPW